MEKVVVTAHFHAAHRQVGYPGKCEMVHGHTWRAKISVSAEELPRDEIDMTLDFGELKQIFRFLDHKMLVSRNDKPFLESGLFDPEGMVVIDGRGPSVENVALYGFRKVVEHIAEKFPGRSVTYDIEVEIQETDNNFFSVRRAVTI